jgi:hypothetical protein
MRKNHQKIVHVFKKSSPKNPYIIWRFRLFCIFYQKMLDFFGGIVYIMGVRAIKPHETQEGVMAWEKTEWACGHSGSMQLYGKMSGRDSRTAWEAGRQCMACWLVGQWEAQSDPRAKREDRYILAGKIAEGKGKRISGLPESVPPKGMEMPQAPAQLGVTADELAEVANG